MITPGMGMLLFRLGILGLAVVTAIHDTWWLRRKAQKATEHQDFLREAA